MGFYFQTMLQVARNLFSQLGKSAHRAPFDNVFEKPVEGAKEGNLSVLTVEEGTATDSDDKVAHMSDVYDSISQESVLGESCFERTSGSQQCQDVPYRSELLWHSSSADNMVPGRHTGRARYPAYVSSSTFGEIHVADTMCTCLHLGSDADTHYREETLQCGLTHGHSSLCVLHSMATEPVEPTILPTVKVCVVPCGM